MGRPEYLLVSGTPVFSGSGRFTGYHGIGRNVTEQRMAELEIDRGARKLSQILQGNPVPMFVLDPFHRVSHWNRACANLTGLDEGDLAGGVPPWKAFHAEPRPLLADLVLDGASEEEIRGLHPFHHPLHADPRCLGGRGMLPRDGGGRALAAHDRDGAPGYPRPAPRGDPDAPGQDPGAGGPTSSREPGQPGFPHRPRQPPAVRGKPGRRSGPGAAGAVSPGHPHDGRGPFQALQIRRSLRASGGGCGAPADRKGPGGRRPGPTDLVARFGGEEFALVMPSTDARGAEVVAERILGAVRALDIPVGRDAPGRVSLSIGVAALVPDPETGGPQGLVAAADRALYQAKESGRGRICVHF